MDSSNSSSKRHHKGQSREHISKKNGPKFGELRKSNNDELGHYAKSVLGDYDDTIKTISSKEQVFGVDRTLPITPVTASYNVFDTTTKCKLDSSNASVTSQERKGPLAPPLSKGEHPLRPPRSQQPSGKSSKSEKHSQSSLSYQQHKPSHRGGKIKPYTRPYEQQSQVPPVAAPESKPHPLATSDTAPSSKPSKKHKKKLRPQEAVDNDVPTSTKPMMSDVGKSLSIPSHVNSPHPIKRSSSADIMNRSPTLQASENSAFTDKTQSGHSHTHRPKKSKKSSRKDGSNSLAPTSHAMPTPLAVINTSDSCVNAANTTVIDSSSMIGKHSQESRLSVSSVEESDTEVQRMLREMALPPLITPIHTPSKKLDFPFHFPLPTTTSNAILSSPADAVIGTISSSDDSSSSDSSSDSEDSDDENNDTTTPTAGLPHEESTAYILREIEPINTLTPLKSSPPSRPHLHSSLSPLVTGDESANLSPAKPQLNMIKKHQSSSLIENSLGFSHMIEGTTPIPVSVPHHPEAETMTSDSGSSSSDEDSDTDSDSSDSEDESPMDTQPKSGSALLTHSTSQSQSHASSQQASYKTTLIKNEFDYEDITEPFPTSQDQLHQSHDQLPPKKPKRKRESSSSTISKISKCSSNQSVHGSKISLSEIKHETYSDDEQEPAYIEPSHSAVKEEKDISMLVSMLVSIPLSKLNQKPGKPQATVGPYNISSSVKRPVSESGESTDTPSRRRHGRYGREGSDSYRDSYHGDHGRGQRDRRGWSIEYDGHGSSSRRGGDRRDHDRWDRSSPPHMGEDYWDYHGYDGRRREEQRQYSERSRSNSEYYYERAKTLKREADLLPHNGVRKAIRYMESVAYFMRHGYSQEPKWDDNGGSSSNKAYRIYSDTVNMIKYCMKIGSDCKPLQIVCLRCKAVLLWRMYVLKQPTIHQLNKELTDTFSNTSKLHGRQKSPNPIPATFSPLPSPASVGSSTSSCSGLGSTYASQDQSLPLSRPTCSKITEYLTITGYISQAIEFWKQSTSLINSFRDIFASGDRRVGKVTQFSPVSQVAEWIEQGLQSLSNRWN